MVQYYTQEGLARLQTELDGLKGKGRKDIANQISEARDKGDLSENAEYDAAKEAQGLLELRISKLEKVLGNARVLDTTHCDTSRVGILAHVKIARKDVHKTFTYQLVAEEEADLKSSKISIQSPIGKSLMGRAVGDLVEIQAPASSFSVEVLDISY